MQITSGRRLVRKGGDVFPRKTTLTSVAPNDNNLPPEGNSPLQRATFEKDPLGQHAQKNKIPVHRPVKPYLANPREGYNRKGDVSLKTHNMHISRHLEGCKYKGTSKDAHTQSTSKDASGRTSRRMRKERKPKRCTKKTQGNCENIIHFEK